MKFLDIVQTQTLLLLGIIVVGVQSKACHMNNQQQNDNTRRWNGQGQGNSRFYGGGGRGGPPTGQNWGRYNSDPPPPPVNVIYVNPKPQDDEGDILVNNDPFDPPSLSKQSFGRQSNYGPRRGPPGPRMKGRPTSTYTSYRAPPQSQVKRPPPMDDDIEEIDPDTVKKSLDEIKKTLEEIKKAEKRLKEALGDDEDKDDRPPIKKRKRTPPKGHDDEDDDEPPRPKPKKVKKRPIPETDDEEDDDDEDPPRTKSKKVKKRPTPTMDDEDDDDPEDPPRLRPKPKTAKRKPIPRADDEDEDEVDDPSPPPSPKKKPRTNNSDQDNKLARKALDAAAEATKKAMGRIKELESENERLKEEGKARRVPDPDPTIPSDYRGIPVPPEITKEADFKTWKKIQDVLMDAVDSTATDK